MSFQHSALKHLLHSTCEHRWHHIMLVGPIRSTWVSTSSFTPAWLIVITELTMTVFVRSHCHAMMHLQAYRALLSEFGMPLLSEIRLEGDSCNNKPTGIPGWILNAGLSSNSLIDVVIGIFVVSGGSGWRGGGVDLLAYKLRLYLTWAAIAW